MVISIFKFLARYYGVALDAGSDLSHTELKKKYKFLKRCSFKYALHNRDLIQSGKIIYVRDSVGVIFPYVTPKEIIIADKDCEYTEKEKHKVIEDNFSVIDEIENLPTYQVRELLSRYKEKPSFYRIIKAELISRGIYENKKYRLIKEIIEMEDSDINDKYQRRRKIKCKES